MRRLKGLQAALESSSSDDEGDSLDRLRPRVVRGSKVRYDRPALQLSGADAANLSGYNLPGIVFPLRSLQSPSFADILNRRPVMRQLEDSAMDSSSEGQENVGPHASSSTDIAGVTSTVAVQNAVRALGLGRTRPSSSSLQALKDKLRISGLDLDKGLGLDWKSTSAAQQSARPSSTVSRSNATGPSASNGHSIPRQPSTVYKPAVQAADRHDSPDPPACSTSPVKRLSPVRPASHQSTARPVGAHRIIARPTELSDGLLHSMEESQLGRLDPVAIQRKAFLEAAALGRPSVRDSGEQIREQEGMATAVVTVSQDGPAFHEKKGSSSAAMGGFEHRLIEDFRKQQNIRQQLNHEQQEQQIVAAGASPTQTAVYPASGAEASVPRRELLRQLSKQAALVQHSASALRTPSPVSVTRSSIREAAAQHASPNQAGNGTSGYLQPIPAFKGFQTVGDDFEQDAANDELEEFDSPLPKRNSRNGQDSALTAQVSSEEVVAPGDADGAVEITAVSQAAKPLAPASKLSPVQAAEPSATGPTHEDVATQQSIAMTTLEAAAGQGQGSGFKLAEESEPALDAPRVSSGVLDLTPVASGSLEEGAMDESGEQANASAAAVAADVAVTGLRQQQQQIPITGLAASPAMVTEDEEAVHEQVAESALLQVLSTSFYTVRCGLLAAEGVESIFAQMLRQVFGRNIAPAEGGWGMVRSCRRALMHVETAAAGAAGAATGAAICMQRLMAYLAGGAYKWGRKSS